MVDGMNPAIQLRILMMYDVPDEVLCVKQKKCTKSINEELQYSWSINWQQGWRHNVLVNQHRREDKHQVVVHTPQEALSHHSRCWSSLLLDLVAMKKGYLFSKEVQHSKWKTEEEVAGEGNQDHEERRGDDRKVMEE